MSAAWFASTIFDQKRAPPLCAHWRTLTGSRADELGASLQSWPLALGVWPIRFRLEDCFFSARMNKKMNHCKYFLGLSIVGLQGCSAVQPETTTSNPPPSPADPPPYPPFYPPYFYPPCPPARPVSLPGASASPVPSPQPPSPPPPLLPPPAVGALRPSPVTSPSPPPNGYQDYNLLWIDVAREYYLPGASASPVPSPSPDPNSIPKALAAGGIATLLQGSKALDRKLWIESFGSMFDQE